MPVLHHQVVKNLQIFSSWELFVYIWTQNKPFGTIVYERGRVRFYVQNPPVSKVFLETSSYDAEPTPARPGWKWTHAQHKMHLVKYRAAPGLSYLLRSESHCCLAESCNLLHPKTEKAQSLVNETLRSVCVEEHLTLKITAECQDILIGDNWDNSQQ